MRLKRERSVYVELVCIRGWRALAVRGHSQLCSGVCLPREEVPWLIGEMRPLLFAPTSPIPAHIARAWGPLRVHVSPKGVRLWRSAGSWPVEGVAIAATEARDVATLLDPPRGALLVDDPIAYAVLVPPSRRGGPWTWVVPRCPLCAGRHVHGAGMTQEGARELLGHRCAHCVGRSPLDGYVLVEASEHEAVQSDDAP